MYGLEVSSFAGSCGNSDLLCSHQLVDRRAFAHIGVAHEANGELFFSWNFNRFSLQICSFSLNVHPPSSKLSLHFFSPGTPLTSPIPFSLSISVALFRINKSEDVVRASESCSIVIVEADSDSESSDVDASSSSSPSSSSIFIGFGFSIADQKMAWIFFSLK